MSALTETLPLYKDPERLEKRLSEIPAEPGVYFMKDDADNILYIGKSKKLRSRVRSYFRELQHHPPRIAMMVMKLVTIDFIVTDTESEALALEANLIKHHQPPFNVLLRDDKKYPYLCITWSENYPRIFITRKRRLGKTKDRYYGPYTNVGLLRSTLHLVQRIFPLRQRRKPQHKNRPCLNYDMGRCPGVCQELITPEDYQKTLKSVAMIFQGRSTDLEDILTAQMEKAAEDLNFELAAKLRDQIAGLRSLTTTQKVASPDDQISRDAIALAADDHHACVQLFQIRAGRLVGQLGFVAVAGSDPGAILQRVLEEHYQYVDSVEIPLEILVQHELPEGELLADYLSTVKGRKVTILSPQRQTKADLIDMVERNAAHELARTQQFADRNHQAMLELADLLDLPDLPHRIEGYDISHIQGSDVVASQVVFIDGLPAKQHYRHYKIKNPEIKPGHSDDFASMAEVIRRRFRKYVGDEAGKQRGNRAGEQGNRTAIAPQSPSPLASPIPTVYNDFPDLVMIDGGKGQLSSVVEVLQEMDLLDRVRVVSLAKKQEQIFLPGESFPLDTQPDDPAVQLLRRLRDEAHRFAVSFHRQQRSDRMRRSRLAEIPGLGQQRQKELLGHFRSIDYLREATPEQIAEVPGIGSRLAQQVYEYFHPAASNNDTDLDATGLDGVES